MCVVHSMVEWPHGRQRVHWNSPDRMVAMLCPMILQVNKRLQDRQGLPFLYEAVEK